MHFAKAIRLDMGVDFRGAYVRMAEKKLDCAQVSAALKEVGRKGMAESVGGNGTAYACQTDIFFYHFPDVLPAHARSGTIDEEQVSDGKKKGAAGVQIVGQKPLCHLVQWNKAFLAPFAESAKHPPLQINIGHAELAELGGPQSCGIEQLEHAAIPLPPSGFCVRHFQNPRHFLPTEHLGTVPGEFGIFQQKNGIGLQNVFFDGKGEEGSQCG